VDLAHHLKNYPVAMPGSKRRVIAHLWPHMPRPPSGRVIVPFFGTGADSCFFAAQGLRVIASDAQPCLVSFHNNAVECYDAAAQWLRGVNWPHDDPRGAYDALRTMHNDQPRAWSFYLLSRLSFNKLVRHNRKGAFNAPIGDMRPNPLPPREDIVRHAQFIESIGGVACADYRSALCSIWCPNLDDLVYLDPPYFGTFDAYTGRPFSHGGLFAHLHRLAARDVAWACSNSPAAREHVPEQARVIEVTRAGTMSSDTSKRDRVAEILVVFDPRDSTRAGSPLGAVCTLSSTAQSATTPCA
jgi:site-specific DNA-adenine methylase